MRCLACNCCLSDYEATRKGAESLEFVDLCDKCFEHIRGSFAVVERDDLKVVEYREEDHSRDKDMEDPGDY